MLWTPDPNGCPTQIAQDELPAEEKLAFFRETRHTFGRTALLLSGGGGLGTFHIGVVKALFEARLLPRVLAGSSVGSIGGWWVVVWRVGIAVIAVLAWRGQAFLGFVGGWWHGAGQGGAAPSARVRAALTACTV